MALGTEGNKRNKKKTTQCNMQIKKKNQHFTFQHFTNPVTQLRMCCGVHELIKQTCFTCREPAWRPWDVCGLWSPGVQPTYLPASDLVQVT